MRAAAQVDARTGEEVTVDDLDPMDSEDGEQRHYR
jgi:hypothetical protein